MSDRRDLTSQKIVWWMLGLFGTCLVGWAASTESRISTATANVAVLQNETKNMNAKIDDVQRTVDIGFNKIDSRLGKLLVEVRKN